MRRRYCLICGSKKLTEIINLGTQPFADSFVPEECLGESDPAYPLICDLCRKCGQVQTAYTTDPRDRYSQIHDYSYTSSNSSFATQHWKEYAAQIPANIHLQRGAFIVEIGSNDGFLSEQFQQRGFRVLGIDASKYMARLARRRNVETVVALFGKEVAIEIRRKYGNADLIVANNVFNHANAPVDFAEGVARLLSDGGHFVFEQPYWLTTVRSKKIDQIYHEHVTYFTVKSARRLLRAANMCIVEAEVVNYHGGSLRVYARKVVNLPRERKGTTEMIRIEERARLFDELNYRELMAEILRLRNAFLKKIYGLKEKGVPIIAVGAPAKGNTFLNFYRLDRTVVNYVTDTSPHKQGKYTPLTRIPIVADSVFAQFKNPYALVLSWNIIDSIRPKLKRINAAIKYISPEQHQG